MHDDSFGFFLVGIFLSTLFWLTILGVTPDSDRRGYFYVANESNGSVIRMDNANGNYTNITKPMTVEQAVKLCNQFNKDIVGYNNDPSRE